jgi:hypothetical protein
MPLDKPNQVSNNSLSTPYIIVNSDVAELGNTVATLQGTTGAQGTQGIQGITGSQGIVSGTSAPASQGVLWLDTTATAVAPKSYQVISSGNLTATATNTFNVPTGGYSRLELVVQNWGQAAGQLRAKINSDGGSNYYQNGVGAYAFIDTASSDDGSGNNIAIFKILYSESAVFAKPIEVSLVGTGNTFFAVSPQLWAWNNSSNAVSSINLLLSNGGNFSASGSYTLYGIL